MTIEEQSNLILEKLYELKALKIDDNRLIRDAIQNKSESEFKELARYLQNKGLVTYTSFHGGQISPLKLTIEGKDYVEKLRRSESKKVAISDKLTGQHQNSNHLSIQGSNNQIYVGIKNATIHPTTQSHAGSGDNVTGSKYDEQVYVKNHRDSIQYSPALSQQGVSQEDFDTLKKAFEKLTQAQRSNLKTALIQLPTPQSELDKISVVQKGLSWFNTNSEAISLNLIASGLYDVFKILAFS
jgi:hypothetical protein